MSTRGMKMFYITTHKEKTGVLLIFYWVKLSHTYSGYTPNESEWIVPGTIEE
jgi:hypothetical protein